MRRVKWRGREEWEKNPKFSSCVIQRVVRIAPNQRHWRSRSGKNYEFSVRDKCSPLITLVQYVTKILPSDSVPFL